MRRAISDWLYRLVLIFLIGLAGLTTRKVWINRHVLESLTAQGQNYLLALWHNNLVYFTYILREFDITVLASRSRDGTNIGRVAAFFGIGVAWGSTADRAFEGLRAIYRLLRGGKNVTVMPDGPLGPRYELKPGVVALARRTGVPIVPIAFSGASVIEFRSWDRMKLPRPFSRVALYVGDPIWIAKDADEEEQRLLVERALREAVVIADRFSGGDLVEREPLLAQVVKPGGILRRG